MSRSPFTFKKIIKTLQIVISKCNLYHNTCQSVGIFCGKRRKTVFWSIFCYKNSAHLPRLIVQIWLQYCNLLNLNGLMGLFGVCAIFLSFATKNCTLLTNLMVQIAVWYDSLLNFWIADVFMKHHALSIIFCWNSYKRKPQCNTMYQSNTQFFAIYVLNFNIPSGSIF